jgi:hypothetical protein
MELGAGEFLRAPASDDLISGHCVGLDDSHRFVREGGHDAKFAFMNPERQLIAYFEISHFFFLVVQGDSAAIADFKRDHADWDIGDIRNGNLNVALSYLGNFTLELSVLDPVPYGDISTGGGCFRKFS